MADRGKWSSTGRDYPVEEKLAEIDREIVRRKATFPGHVRSGAVAEDVAIKRLDIMRAIARDYRARLEANKLVPRDREKKQ